MDLKFALNQRDMLVDEVLAIERNICTLEAELVDAVERNRVIQSSNSEQFADLQFCLSLPGVQAQLNAKKGIDPHRKGFLPHALYIPAEFASAPLSARHPFVPLVAVDPSSTPIRRHQPSMPQLSPYFPSPVVVPPFPVQSTRSDAKRKKRSSTAEEDRPLKRRRKGSAEPSVVESDSWVRRSSRHFKDVSLLEAGVLEPPELSSDEDGDRDKDSGLALALPALGSSGGKMSPDTKRRLLQLCEHLSRAKKAGNVRELQAVLLHDPNPMQLLKDIDQHSRENFTTRLMGRVKHLAAAVNRLGLLPGGVGEEGVEALTQRVERAVSISLASNAPEPSTESNESSSDEPILRSRVSKPVVAAVGGEGGISALSDDLKLELLCCCKRVANSSKSKSKRLQELLAVLNFDPEPLQLLKNILQHPSRRRKDRSFPYYTSIKMRTLKQLARAVKQRLDILPDKAEKRSIEALTERVERALAVGKEEEAGPEGGSGSDGSSGVSDSDDAWFRQRRGWGRSEAVTGTKYAFRRRTATPPNTPDHQPLESERPQGSPAVGKRPMVSKRRNSVSQSVKAEVAESCFPSDGLQLLRGSEELVRAFPSGGSLRLEEFRAVILYDPEPLEFLRAVNRHTSCKKASNTDTYKTVQMRALKKLAVWAGKRGMLPEEGEAIVSIRKLKRRFERAITLAEQDMTTESDSEEVESTDVLLRRLCEAVAKEYPIARDERLQELLSVITQDPSLQLLKNVSVHSATEFTSLRMGAVKRLATAVCSSGLLPSTAAEVKSVESLARLVDAAVASRESPLGKLTL